MTKLVFVNIGLLFALAGCVTTQPDPFAARYNACANMGSWLLAAKCTDSVAADDPRTFSDGNLREEKAFRAMLVEKVETGTMTEAEARYALQQKINEVNARMTQYRAAPVAQPTPGGFRARVPMVAPVKSRETHCSPDGLGGFRCAESGVRQPDLSVFDIGR